MSDSDHADKNKNNDDEFLEIHPSAPATPAYAAGSYVVQMEEGQSDANNATAGITVAGLATWWNQSSSNKPRIIGCMVFVIFVIVVVVCITTVIPVQNNNNNNEAVSSKTKNLESLSPDSSASAGAAAGGLTDPPKGPDSAESLPPQQQQLSAAPSQLTGDPSQSTGGPTGGPSQSTDGPSQLTDIPSNQPNTQLPSDNPSTEPSAITTFSHSVTMVQSYYGFNLCIDSSADPNDEGVLANDCYASASMKWSFNSESRQIVNIHNQERCLAVNEPWMSFNKNPELIIVQWCYSNKDNQKWYLTGNTIQSSDGKCVTRMFNVPLYETIQIRDCDDSVRQKWHY